MAYDRRTEPAPMATSVTLGKFCACQARLTFLAWVREGGTRYAMGDRPRRALKCGERFLFVACCSVVAFSTKSRGQRHEGISLGGSWAGDVGSHGFTGVLGPISTLQQTTLGTNRRRHGEAGSWPRGIRSSGDREHQTREVSPGNFQHGLRWKLFLLT